MKKANILHKNSVIGIAAASSSFDRDKFEKGCKILKSSGFRLKFNDKIFNKEYYLAGNDERRADELNSLLNDPEVEAVMFARGGYGLQRILEKIDFKAVKRNPKIIVGFSDLTPLLNYISSKYHIPTFYGPVITALKDDNGAALRSLHTALTSLSPLTIPDTGDLKILKEGTAEGRLFGGCLTLLSTSLATPYEVIENNSLLFIEDHNEPIYKYDRLLTHLKNAGIFERVSGIVFGSLKVGKQESDPDYMWKMLDDIFSDFNGPVVYGLSSGHTDPFFTIPLGLKLEIVADNSHVKINFKEAALG